MNSNELKSMSLPHDPSKLHTRVLGVERQEARRQHESNYWLAFVAFLAIFALTGWWLVYSTGQDHIASIPLNGDGTWYYNYEVGFQIQDQDIFYHDIGASIENARKADVIFLGASRPLFALDRRVFDDFAQKHNLKMFNMGFAGIPSGEFSLRIIRKFGLHPKLWIINTDRDLNELSSGFFFPSLTSGAGLPASTVMKYDRLRALRNVLGRNIRWRLKLALGSLRNWSYRSAKTGNWYLDNWPAYRDKNPAIEPREMHRGADGAFYQTKRVDFTCPAETEEVDEAKRYITEIGGVVILIEVPNAFACAQRVHELGSFLGVPAFTVGQTEFTSTDGGGHLDAASAHKYSEMLFAWLEQLPEFQRLFPE